MTLYQDPDTGKLITTHSMLRTFRRCPKQTQYKYIERLKPRAVSRPLKRGSWIHSLLEAYYKGEDWRKVHAHLAHQFSELFDEEKEMYGDLPDMCRRIMESYLWHYEEEEWEVHEVEYIIDVDFPDKSIYRCRVDLLIEDQLGLWLVDHKTKKSIPKHDYRILEAQSALYVWAARRAGIPVEGFIWNYIRAKAPAIPEPIKDGSRISRWSSIDTDYPTAVRALKEYGFWNKKDIQPYVAKLTRLKNMRYEPGELQRSPFFQRFILEKDAAMLKRVAQEAYHTHKRMHSYFPPPHPDAIERVVEESCYFSCSFTDLCSVELFGGNSRLVRRRFTKGDPLDYYNDDKYEESDGD